MKDKNLKQLISEIEPYVFGSLFYCPTASNVIRVEAKSCGCCLEEDILFKWDYSCDKFSEQSLETKRKIEKLLKPEKLEKPAQ